MTFQEFKDKYEKVPVKEYPNSVSKNPVVSVCVQTFQHGSYIRECLDGILMQETDFPFEILLGEDASTDGTREICMEYAEKHPNIIRLFLHHRENNIKINGTPSGRFNFVYNVLSVKGKYIAICEGDDYWTDPLKLQKQIDFLAQNSNVVLSFHDCDTVDSENRIINNSRLNLKGKSYLSYKDIMRSKHLPTNTLVVKKEIIIKAILNKAIQNIYNLDTFILCFCSQFGLFYYAENVKNSCYRIHGGGMWNKENLASQLAHGANTFFQLFKTVKKYKYKRLLIQSYISKLFNMYYSDPEIAKKYTNNRFYQTVIKYSVYSLRFKMLLYFFRKQLLGSK